MGANEGERRSDACSVNISILKNDKKKHDKDK